MINLSAIGCPQVPQPRTWRLGTRSGAEGRLQALGPLPRGRGRETLAPAARAEVGGYGEV